MWICNLLINITFSALNLFHLLKYFLGNLKLRMPFRGTHSMGRDSWLIGNLVINSGLCDLCHAYLVSIQMSKDLITDSAGILRVFDCFFHSHGYGYGTVSYETYFYGSGYGLWIHATIDAHRGGGERGAPHVPPIKILKNFHINMQ